jgi:hypothetical protein
MPISSASVGLLGEDLPFAVGQECDTIDLKLFLDEPKLSMGKVIFRVTLVSMQSAENVQCLLVETPGAEPSWAFGDCIPSVLASNHSGVDATY